MRAMRWAGVFMLAGLLGCTSVRFQARDGCWVRQTEKLGRVIEEIGPCAKPESTWVADRPTRLVQECMAQASWRYQNEALAAWGRGERALEPLDEARLLESCQLEATRAVTQQNEALEARLAELRGDHERAVAHNEHLSDVLGEAAKKPAGTATATANADGRSTSTNDSRSAHTADVAAPQTPIVVPYQGVLPAPDEAKERIVVRYSPKPKTPVAKPIAAKATPVKNATAEPEKLVCEPSADARACDCACPSP